MKQAVETGQLKPIGFRAMLTPTWAGVCCPADIEVMEDGHLHRIAGAVRILP